MVISRAGEFLFSVDGRYATLSVDVDGDLRSISEMERAMAQLMNGGELAAIETTSYLMMLCAIAGIVAIFLVYGQRNYLVAAPLMIVASVLPWQRCVLAGRPSLSASSAQMVAVTFDRYSATSSGRSSASSGVLA